MPNRDVGSQTIGQEKTMYWACVTLSVKESTGKRGTENHRGTGTGTGKWRGKEPERVHRKFLKSK